MGLLNLTRDSIFGAFGLPSFALEFFDVIIMSLALGYIFADYFIPYTKSKIYDPLIQFKRPSGLKYAIVAVAPAIVLHELMHKFVGLAFGVPSTFYASYGWLALGILLKLFGSPLLFFVPGYVSHPIAPPLTSSIIAVAGPLTNLIIWGICAYLIKNYKKYNFSETTLMVLGFSRKINLFLFIFNMLPIPPFDGFQFFSGLLGGLF